MCEKLGWVEHYISSNICVFGRAETIHIRGEKKLQTSGRELYCSGFDSISGTIM